MPDPYRKSSKTPKKTPWRRRLLLFGGLVIVLFSVGLVVGRFKTRDVAGPPLPVKESPPPSGREVILYFASVDGQKLIGETRSVSECQSDEDCLRDTVKALIAGPGLDLVPIFPARVELRDVAVTGSLVNLDFSRQLIDAHPGGTQSELLTIYGLADTLAVNFPHLRQVQIMVEGAHVATLKGHVDLRQPINPDFGLVQEGTAPVGKMTNLPVGSDE